MKTKFKERLAYRESLEAMSDKQLKAEFNKYHSDKVYKSLGDIVHVQKLNSKERVQRYCLNLVDMEIKRRNK